MKKLIVLALLGVAILKVHRKPVPVPVPAPEPTIEADNILWGT